jgi:hypothetical protein
LLLYLVEEVRFWSLAKAKEGIETTTLHVNYSGADLEHFL